MTSLKHHYPIDSFGIQKVTLSGIRVERLEDRLDPNVPFPHKHDFSQVLLVTHGKGIHQIDFKRYPAQAGDLFLMKPGQTHTWKFSKGVKGLLVEFHHQSLKDTTSLLNQYLLTRDHLRITDKKAFKDFVLFTGLMMKEFKNQKALHDLSLQGYLLSFLIELLRFHEFNLKENKTLSVIEKFKKLIEDHFKTHHEVAFYAKALGIGGQALTMQLTRSIGKPPRLLIQERILLEAKRYLVFSELSVAEIGYELGFLDANYFTRFFRSHEKITPAAFRKMAK